MKWLLLLFVSSVLAVPALAQESDSPYRALADYSADHRGDALLVYENDQLVFEEYQNGYDGSTPHVLYSGTKSFTCALAVAAVEDGLLTLDERASDTLTEWQDDSQHATITVRDLLTLTSGLSDDRALNRNMVRDRAAYVLAMDLTANPGEVFQYGPPNFYAFTELLRRRLNGETVLDYFERRIVVPAGIDGLTIDTDRAGNPNFASGGRLTAREWAEYGHLILHEGTWNGQRVLDADLLRECFTSGTAANPYYGLTWWLEYDLNRIVELQGFAAGTDDPGPVPDGVVLGETMPAVFVAAGAAQQRLVVIPERGLVIVRFGRQDRRFSDVAFLDLLP